MLKFNNLRNFKTCPDSTGSSKFHNLKLIVRDDNVINICEMKFYNTKYTINKKYANELANKVQRFKDYTKTTKNIFITFITSYGLKENRQPR